MTVKTAAPSGQYRVSSGNPCPFLRALVADGRLADGLQPVRHVVDTVADAVRKGEGSPEIPRISIYAIAVTANGVNPSTLVKTGTQGVRLNELRGGPFDKKGVGSAIINSAGEIDLAQLARLKTFASPKVMAAGVTVLGLDSDEIRQYMTANLKRANGRQRLVDRTLMNGEWPVLLKVMGKEGAAGRYLAFDDVETLFLQRRLPAGMVV